MLKTRLSSSFFFILIVLAVVVVTAFALAGQQPAQLSNLAEGELKDLVIKLERKGCYGNCPSYKDNSRRYCPSGPSPCCSHPAARVRAACPRRSGRP